MTLLIMYQQYHVVSKFLIAIFLLQVRSAQLAVAEAAVVPDEISFDIWGDRIQYNSTTWVFSQGVTQSVSVESSSTSTSFAIGIPEVINLDNVTGHVVVYQRNTTSERWEPKGATIYGTVPYEGFGYSVAMTRDGSMIVVGSHNPYWQHIQTRVTVFGYNTINDQWEQVGPAVLFNEPNLRFDGNLAISSDGTTIAFQLIAMIKNLVSDVYVRTMKYNASSRYWEQIGNDIHGTFEVPSNYTITPETEIDVLEHMESTFLMSDDGTTIALGIRRRIFYKQIVYNEDRPDDFAIVRVYQLNNNNKENEVMISQQQQPKWEQVGSDIDGRALDDLYRGTIMALSGDGTMILVGVSYGISRIYKLLQPSSSSSLSLPKWEQLGADLVTPATVGVTMSSDGATIAVGRNNNVNNRFTFDLIVDIHQLVQDDNDIDTTQHQERYSLVEMFKPQTRIPIPLRHQLSMDMSADGSIIALGNHIQSDQLNFVEIYKQSERAIVTAAPVASPIPVLPIMTPTPIQPTVVPTKNPRTISSPTSVHCKNDGSSNTNIATYRLYDSRTDTVVATLTNGTVINNPPPMNRTNIEAVIACNNDIGAMNNSTIVVIQLYNSSTNVMIHYRQEKYYKYFLFGDNTKNVYNGRIVPGTYNIRVIVNRTIISPFTTFTLL